MSQERTRLQQQPKDSNYNYDETWLIEIKCCINNRIT